MRVPVWILAILLLVAAAYAVPYLLLPEAESWAGVFPFWLAFGVAVWLILVGRVVRWNVEVGPPARQVRCPSDAPLP